MEQKRKAVFLPIEVYGSIEERVEAAGLCSVDEYVLSSLKEVLNKEEKKEANKRLKALVLSVLERL
jgi:hypothetical protein